MQSAVAGYISKILEEKGFESFAVGGGVRDHFLGLPPHDVDIATNALPENVKAAFEEQGLRVIETGIKHGTVTVHFHTTYYYIEGEIPAGTSVEITTYRVDGEYSDGRRPENVRFTGNIEEDLARRDFTMNAIAFNPQQLTYTDPFYGIVDIKKKTIRAVGNAKERFLEDGLRPLRALRFQAQLGFKLDSEIVEAFKDAEVIETIKKVSIERVREEILKGLKTNAPLDFVLALYEHRLLDLYIPELIAGEDIPQPKKFHKFQVLNHSFAVLDKFAQFSKDPVLRLVALLHDVGKPISWNQSTEDPHFYGHEDTGAEAIEVIFRRLKFSNEEIETAKSLVANHMKFYDPQWSDAKVKRWINEVGKERVDAQIALHKADLYGTFVRSRWAELPLYDELLERAKTIIAKAEALTVRDLKLNGFDLMALGFQGQQIAVIKNALLEKVLENPSLNTKEQLKELVLELATDPFIKG